ncbi:tetraspanin-33 [Exaiptasia diaphana]|uniref:Tetraspanin n=1 Tax=Exaiptasia diaphana TaxID=2652724 RepID=A0A913XAW4_EXADI|nr:tetraspanin-33 [Exaiptasia diaphana]KXJ13453.1 Tetraspanin-33 [Exaiptasia diaphana]
MYSQEDTKHVVSKCLKYLLFTFNLFYWIVGSVMFGIGIWAVTQKSTFTQLASVATDPAAILIAVGILIIIISFFGTVGALREYICFLQFYKWTMVVIVILEILAGLLAFAFWPEVEASLETQLKKGIKNYRENIDLQNIIDKVQTEFQCCGGGSSNDWDINRYFKCGGPSPEECGVPHTCCRMKEGQQINIQCGWQVRKQVRTEQKKTIYVTSCISALKIWFKDHMFIVGAVAIALAFPQFLGIILTHIFVGQIQEQIEECSKPPMYKYRPDRQPLAVDS